MNLHFLCGKNNRNILGQFSPVDRSVSQAHMSECKCCTMKVKWTQGINKIFISKAFLSVAMLLSEKRQMRSTFYAILAQHIFSQFHFFPFRFTVGGRIFLWLFWVSFCASQTTSRPVYRNFNEISILMLQYFASIQMRQQYTQFLT